MSRLIGGQRALVALAPFGALTVVVLALWAYWPALDAPFVFDDQQNIVDSPAIRWTELSWDNLALLLDASRLQSRPVSNFSFALDYMRVGLEPRGFHLTNLLIHFAVGGALMWLCLLYVRVAHGSSGPPRSVRTSTILSLLPVGLFLVHPLNTQAVTYVVQRMTSLAALFTLLAFVSYLMARYRVTARSRWWYLAMLLFWFLAVGSKEIGLLLLPVILIYEVCFFRGEWCRKIEVVLDGTWSRKWTITAWAGFGAVTAIGVWLAMSSTDVIGLSADFPSRDFNGLERLMSQARVQIFHLSQLIWPVSGRLNLDHDFVVSRGLLQPLTTLPAVLACIGLIMAAIYLALWQPRYGFPLLAYAAFHLIEAGPIGLEIIYEHRMYLPSSMLVLAGAALIVDCRPRRQLVALVTIVAVTPIFAVWTHERNQQWADSLEFHRDMAMKSPSNTRVQYNLALILKESGRDEQALPVIRRAIALDPLDGDLRRLFGSILVDLDRADDAVLAYRDAVRLEPQKIRSILGLGAALEASGAEDEAFDHYLSTGTRFGRAGAPWEAIPILKRAVELLPADAGARNALGSAYMTVGLTEQALEQFQQAVVLDPAKIEAWYNLGLAADGMGRIDEAIRAYQGFVERAPPKLQQPIAHARTRIDALISGVTR